MVNCPDLQILRGQFILHIAQGLDHETFLNIHIQRKLLVVNKWLLLATDKVQKYFFSLLLSFCLIKYRLIFNWYTYEQVA